MRTIKLVMEYDGMDFSGFQKQKRESLRTVQDALESALAALLREPVKTAVAGRTDAGVHALAQVASFKTSSSMAAGEMKRALNAILPETVCIHEVEDMEERFHARFSAQGRVYVYCVLNSELRSPLVGRRAFHLWKPLDLGMMRQAAEYLTGEHDFTTFCTAIKENEKRTRRIDWIKIQKGAERETWPLACPPGLIKDLIAFEFKGSGFLRSMVRMMMAALIKVGTGKLSPPDIGQMLKRKDPGQVNASVPPWGLFLVNIDYGEGKVGAGEK